MLADSIVRILTAMAYSETLNLSENFDFRARELFYYLKGGQVDYGEEHSRMCGHSQFGKNYGKGTDRNILVGYF